MKAVLDVNVIVSAAIAPLGASRAIIDAARRGDVDLATSHGIIAEVEDKLKTPRIGGRYRLTAEDVGIAVASLTSQAQVVIVPAGDVQEVTGDPEDDYVLATARMVEADYLVTGDRALLALGEHAGVQIISPRQFVDLLGG